LTLAAIRNGAGGVRDTLDVMVALAKSYRTNLEIRNLAESLVRDIPQKDYWSEAEAIQRYVRDRIRYTQDTYDMEMLKTPLELLASRQGDCDDKSLLAATLLLSIGHPARFKAIGYAPGEYEHVYTETKIGDEWVSVETTEPVELGWIPRQPSSVMVRHI